MMEWGGLQPLDGGLSEVNSAEALVLVYFEGLGRWLILSDIDMV